MYAFLQETLYEFSICFKLHHQRVTMIHEYVKDSHGIHPCIIDLHHATIHLHV